MVKRMDLTKAGTGRGAATFAIPPLGAKGRASLDKIATCFIGGPLAGRNLSLLGHADPRGDNEYNLLLGGRRAQTVSRALSSRGVPLAQLSATSHGEMDALGTDETSWVQDRRVSLDLAKQFSYRKHSSSWEG